ncbi:hypothetical protein TNCT_390271 [Trichonephila clavata]|uniref:SAGA-associated factor 11 n=1 Tax=Trichonephila clavata TaxID=2740835 RepID=A0A8X6G4E4_TRICU|nr:hypothetical protein TNCT_390271 [Trichonephila clavata]
MAIEEEESNEIHISKSEKASTLAIKENALEFCKVIFIQKTNDPIDSDKNLSSKYPLNMIKPSPLKVPAEQLLIKVENGIKDPENFPEEKAVLIKEDCDFCDPNTGFMENLLNEIENEAKDDNSSNPYVEYIRMLEKKYPKVKCDSCRKKELEDKYTAASLSKETNKEVKKNNPSTSANGEHLDIFGNPLSSKTSKKISVNCPHCKKKVSASQFVRHLCYCMGVGIRKRTRR